MEFGTNIEGRAIRTKSKSKLVGKPSNESIFRGFDEKNVAKKITAKVNLKIKKNENDLCAKRKRLKDLFKQDEQIMYSELYKREMNKKSPKIKKEVKVEEIPDKTQEDEELLAQKMLQLEISKCDEIKTIIAQRRDTETRKFQKMQIDEKSIIKKQEMDKDKIWHNTMLKDAEVRKALEDSEKEKQLSKEKAIKKFLEAQMQRAKELSKKQKDFEKEEERKQSLEINKNLNDIILNEKTEHKDKQSVLNKQLVQQINLKKEINEKHKKNIIDFEKSFILTSLKKHEKDLQNKLNEKKNNQKEVNSFNKYMSKIQSRRKAQSKIDDNFVEGVSSKMMENEDYHRELFKQRRKQLLQKALSDRDAQIEEKKKKAELEYAIMQKEMAERIDLQNKIAQETKREKDDALKTKIAYKKQLEEQIKANKMIKENEMSRMKAEANEKLIQEQQSSNRCMELMKREFNSENTHPFTKVMKNSKVHKDTWYSFIPETKFVKY